MIFSCVARVCVRSVVGASLYTYLSVVLFVVCGLLWRRHCVWSFWCRLVRGQVRGAVVE